MANNVVVQMSLADANVTIAVEDVGYSPDVVDDLKARALDAIRQMTVMDPDDDDDEDVVLFGPLMKWGEDGRP